MESNNELDNFKKLLDIGAITESEFNQLTNKLRIEALPPSEVKKVVKKPKTNKTNISAPKKDSWFKIQNIVQIITVLAFLFFLSLIIISSVGGFKNSVNNNSSPSSSEYKYCEKHKRMYSPDNAYNGCPDCGKENWDKEVEKSAERARRL